MSAIRHSPPPLTKGMSRAKSVRKTSTITGAVQSLTYTTTTMEHNPVSHLSSLTDNRSNYPSVARSCLQLNQFAGSDITASPLHDTMYAKTCTSMFSALAECLGSHQDRRCRILAAKTLAVCGRAAYARIRHSPLLYGMRDGTLHRLEDEVGTDVPVALCTAAMEDADNGVAACAVEALGILCLSSSSMVGTLSEDELLREVEGISHTRPSPYAPSLSDLSDEDPSIPQMELQSRVYENVLLPRIWRIVKRLLQFTSPTDILRGLPFLTSCLVHLMKLAPSTTLGMDRATYAKRWIEVDIVGLVHDVVTCIVLPSLQSDVDGGLAHAAALCGLRFAHACPYAPWARPVCRAAAQVLYEALSAAPAELHRLALLASLLVASRALPLAERMPFLERVANQIRFLPATTIVPPTVTSAGMMMMSGDTNSNNMTMYNRRSARMGLLTELSLSILIDGPSEDDKLRSKNVKDFLSSPEVTSLLMARRHKKNNRKWTSNHSTASNTETGKASSLEAPGGKTPQEAFVGTHVADEFVLALCSVASAYGVQVMESGKSVNNRHVQEWLRCSMAILSSGCSACVNWKSRTCNSASSGSSSATDEAQEKEKSLENNNGNGSDDTNTNESSESFTVLMACQASYVRLLVDCMHAVGFLSPTSSVALHLVPLSTPPRSLLLEDLAQSIASLARFTPIKGAQFAHSKEMATLADQFLEYKFREGVPHRHVRIALIAVLSDHWVQALDHFEEDSENFNMNDMNARELLTMLSLEIYTLTKSLKDTTTSGYDSQGLLRYLDVCVASVENVALMACDWARRHGTASGHGDTFRKDIDEDVSYIVSTATAALEGKNLREGDVLDNSTGSNNGNEGGHAMLPICAEAVKRIQSVSIGILSGGSVANNKDAYGVKPALHSLLVTTASRDFKRRQSNAHTNPLVCSYADVGRTPFISFHDATFEPLAVGDAGLHAFFVQYCLQVIGSRIDQSLPASVLSDLRGDNPVLSVETDGEEKQGVVRARNWLRLTATPPPGVPLAARCSGAVTTLSGASDPVTFAIAYSMRRCLRYDCEAEFRLFVTLRVHNVTAVAIPSGVRLDLRVTQQKSAFDVDDDEEDEEAGMGGVDTVLSSHTAVFKHEIKAGEQVTWEVGLDNCPIKGFLELHPSVTFREMGVEHVPPKMVTMTATENGNDDNESKEDTDTQQTDDHTDGGASVEERTIGEDEDENMDVTLTAEPIQLSPMLGMQPCPLVFFRSRSGHKNTFRFLWHQMPHRMGDMTVYRNTTKMIGSTHVDDFGTAVARLSCIPDIFEYIEGVGRATRGWAFSTLTGSHLLCLMVEQQDDADTAKSATLFFRANHEHLLFSILGSDATRNVVVSSLTQHQWVCDTQFGF